MEMLIILNQKHFLYCIIFSDILLEKKIRTYGLLDKQQKQLFHKKLVISESYESSCVYYVWSAVALSIKAKYWDCQIWI